MKRFARNEIFTEIGLNAVTMSIWPGTSHPKLDQNGQAGVRSAATPSEDIPTDWTLRQGPRPSQPKLRPEAMFFARLDSDHCGLRNAVTARGRAITGDEQTKGKAATPYPGYGKQLSFSDQNGLRFLTKTDSVSPVFLHLSFFYDRTGFLPSSSSPYRHASEMCPASADYRTPTVRTFGHGPRPRQTNCRPEAMRFRPSGLCPPRSSKRRHDPWPCSYRHRKDRKDMRRRLTQSKDNNSTFQTKADSTFRQKLTAFPRFFLACLSSTTERAFPPSCSSSPNGLPPARAARRIMMGGNCEPRVFGP